MVLLATAALMNISRSAETFDYFSRLNDLTSSIRQARDLSLTSREFVDACDGAKDSYVVRIEQKSFAISEGGCRNGEELFDLAGTNYELAVFNDNAEALDFPVELQFMKGLADLSVFSNDLLIPANDSKFVRIDFADSNEDVVRHVVIFQLSGLPEVFENLDIFE